MTANPCGFACDAEDGADGVREMLATALADAGRRPIFDEPEQWPAKAQGSS